MTAQEVIKSFTKQLANHGYASSDSVGPYMLDSAVRASSRYGSIQEAIDAFKADQVQAEMEAVEEVLGSNYAGKTMYDLPDSILDADAKDYDPNNKSNAYYDANNDSRSTVENLIKERMSDIFLQKYCGIILNEKYFFDSSGTVKSWSQSTGNDDTGAITGSDAGTSTTKTKSSVVPEEFINTYTASTTAAQNIITNNRNWVVQATDNNDTITSNAADSISAGAGNDSIIANGSGATITSGDGSDFITISEGVTDITLDDLNEYDTLTISGDFDVGSAQIEDSLLVITDRTGTRKIKLGDFENATSAKVNSTTIANWLANAGISLNNLATKNYSDGKVVSSSNVSNSSAVTVDLDTVDTSAIGNVTVNGAVVGSLSSTFPNASTFTRNGLTIHLLGVASDTSGSTSKITAKTLDELTDAQKTIVAGLFKWWVGDGLTLSEESFGISFNSSTATIKDMGLFFYDGQGSNTTLAAAPYWPRSNDGAITQLMLKINMNYYNNISADDLDGTTTKVKNLLDRTLAHELTHSNMETNINFFNKLPQFFVEGSAELTHGIDDERGNRIFNIAANTSSISTVLDVSNTSTGNANYYAGGFMFLRYFAKTAAAQTLPAFGEITATVNPTSSGDYYISGNKTSETASTTAQDIKLGTVSNGIYTVEDTGVHQVITNTNNFKIAGLTINDTLIGSDSADTVETAQGSYITSGTGSDSIKIYGQFATIDAGADNDTVIAQDGSHHFIDLGDGNDFVEFKLSNIYSNTIAGGAGNDRISLAASNNSSIDMGAGDDSIYFGGHSNIIDAGDGDDTLISRYTNDSENLIELGAGNDRATIYGASNTLDGGTGDDFIYISNASNTFFRYKAGDGSDTINGFNSTSTLIIGGGLGFYTTVQSGRDIIVTVDDGSVFLRNAANLGTVNIDGKEKNPKLIEGTDDPDTIDNALDDATILAYAGDDIITNSGDNVSIDGGADNDSIELNGAGATVNVGEGDDLIQLGVRSEELVVENFGAGDVIQLNATLDNLDTVSGGIIAGDVTISGLELSETTAEWSLDDNVATHELKISEGATLSEDNQSIVFGAASTESMTVSGVGSTDGLAIDTDNKIVTVQSSALNEMDVTISDGYKLVLSGVSAPSTVAAAWSLNGTAATYKSSEMIAGYTLDDNKIVYTAASGGEVLVTVSGVTATSALAIDTANKVVTVRAAALNEQNVTISNGYKLAMGSDVATPIAIEAAWSLDGTTATYKSSERTAGYTLENNQISYTAATDEESLVELSGIATAPTVNGSIVKLSPKNFAGNVSVVSNDGYSFSLSEGNYAGKTFSGNDEDDSITSSGMYVTISGGAGHDSIKVSGVRCKVLGDEGNDLLIGGRGYDTFSYSSGNDTIDGYTAKDKIITSSDYENFSVNGSNLIFSFGDDSLTIQDAVNKKFNMNSATNYYTAEGVYDKKKKSVKLFATTENFTADSKVVTIDGSEVSSAISITGNNKKNLIYAGANGSTLDGGKGKDSLYGGDGADIFIYAKGDGKDVIENFGADDMISLSSNATIKDAKIRSGNSIIKIGSGSLTVKSATEFTIMQDGAEKKFSAGVFIEDDSAKVYGSFSGTINLADYGVKTFDGSLAKKKLTITGDDSANSIIGGTGKDSLIGGAGNDTLWGGKKNDTLYGGAGDDTFIFRAGDGNDVIADYTSGDILQIMNKRGTASADFKKATFKGDTLTLNITGGGKVILSSVESTTSININGENKTVSDWIK